MFGPFQTVCNTLLKQRQGLRAVDTMSYSPLRRPHPGPARQTNPLQTSFKRASPTKLHGRSYISQPYDQVEVDLEEERPVKKAKTEKTTYVDLSDNQGEASDELKMGLHTSPTPNSHRLSRNSNGKSSQGRQVLVPEYSDLDSIVELPKSHFQRQSLSSSNSNDFNSNNNSDNEDEVFTFQAMNQRKARDRGGSISRLQSKNGSNSTDETKSRYFPNSENGLSDRFVGTDGKKRTTNISNESSPDVLHTSETTVNRPNTRVPKPRVANDTTPQFPLKSILHGSLPSDYDMLTVKVDRETRKLSILTNGQLSDDPLLEFPLKKAIRGYHEPNQSIISLEFSKERHNPNKIFLDLRSEKDSVELLRTIEETSNINIRQAKREGWMKQAWQKQSEEHSHNATSTGNTSQSRKAKTEKIHYVAAPSTSVEHSTQPARSLVSHMESSKKRPSSPTPNPRRIPAQPSVTDDMLHPLETDRTLLPDNFATDERKAPSKTYATRSGGRAMTTVIDDDERDTSPLRSFKRVDLGPKWEKSLVYPQSGKNRAEVEFHDLERLQDHEMLNDNLIGFYLRFLQHDLEQHRPDLAEQIYFFNTFFFATLTASGKGRRAINYEGVQKWTRRGVDIFTKKFVVVPINETAHWYVALICNLPALKRKISIEDDFEDHKNPFTDKSPSRVQQENQQASNILTSASQEILPSEMDTDSQNESNRQAVNGMTLDSPSPALHNLAHDSKSTTDTTPASATKTRGSTGKNKHSRLPKYDPDEPIIITLDSLDLTRSPTIRTLKDYVSAEAKAKRAMNVDGSSIKGMSAKGIPIQTNYIDCGLYLLAYIEKFVMDPNRFVHDILRREMTTEEHWPVMKSTDLRQRLRSFLLDLRKTQQGGSDPTTLPAVGSILLGSPRKQSPTPMKDSQPELENIADTDQLGLLANQQDTKDPSPPKKLSSKTAQLSSPSKRRLPRDDGECMPTNLQKQNLQSGKVRHEPIVLDEDSPLKPLEGLQGHVGSDFISQLQDAAGEPNDAAPQTPPLQASRDSSVDTNFLMNSRTDKYIPSQENVPTAPRQNKVVDEDAIANTDSNNEAGIEDSIVVDTQFDGHSHPGYTMGASVVQQRQLPDEIPETQSEEEFEEIDILAQQPARPQRQDPSIQTAEKSEKNEEDSDALLDI